MSIPRLLFRRTLALHTTQARHLSGVPKVFAVSDVAYPRRQKTVRSLTLETILTAELAASPGVFQFTLNRPSRGNSFNMQMWHELKEAFQAADGDHTVRAIILTGNSASFSTGMDLSVFMEMQRVADSEVCEGRKREALSEFIQFLQDSVNAPEVCCVPVIAAISGYCIGGAVDLVTACDLRYCTDSSTFCIKETDLAMVADIGTLQRLPKLIGDQRCRELAYTGRTIGGAEAERLGLVMTSFATEELMNEHVKATALAIAKKSPLTIRGIKKTILFSRDHSTADSLAQIKLYNSAHLFSEDLKEAMQAAMTKKQPSFKGE